ncbi:unnamed protein product [Leptidea sinapis]|uniref:C2H2-type domain-containing protein n=1 Tax=Leptidea sinapis TaxID=189913 RepID=A0A5E4QU95_9NEOP|nr:unnamed protein product [Leptidea sinapis]
MKILLTNFFYQLTSQPMPRNNGPDLLALYSCVICHDIFTTEADLLDHTIFFHASDRPRDDSKVTSNNEELPSENSFQMAQVSKLIGSFAVCVNAYYQQLWNVLRMNSYAA